MMKPSLFAAQEREAKLSKLGDATEPSPGGRPPFPTEVMVRILLIQQLFKRSDEQMAFRLLDRLRFQHFTGLRDSSRIPDRTTIRTFEERLIKAGAS